MSEDTPRSREWFLTLELRPCGWYQRCGTNSLVNIFIVQRSMSLTSCAIQGNHYCTSKFEDGSEAYQYLNRKTDHVVTNAGSIAVSSYRPNSRAAFAFDYHHQDATDDIWGALRCCQSPRPQQPFDAEALSSKAALDPHHFAKKDVKFALTPEGHSSHFQTVVAKDQQVDNQPRLGSQ
ncbi:hypothetical protein PIIN_04592 [Serendipita indica DSM 11827]|uniref:Uncharacterized protein n=1 Tax=Serendipita indica (strain DSM 11827) TaxID=1109443 RepID=G4TH63_SERID|nr:hypothetical protein PIIN_04592 [Serendipita indica DSM 11827]